MATQVKTEGKYSEAEWQARQELAACYRIFAMRGWDEMIYNHITVKIPGEDHAYLINPFGLHYNEVTASSLIKVDRDGNKLDLDNPWHVNPAGLVQHTLFHNNVPGAHAIIHAHTTATMAVCSLEEGLLPINFYAASFAGKLGWHDFEGVTVREDEGRRLLANLGNHQVLMLRNHGPVVLGKTLPEAFHIFFLLQRACEVQVATLGMGKPVMIAPAVTDTHDRDTAKMRVGGMRRGQLEFDAMIRQIDRIDRSWRD
jgi:ribulose-5-phosphate 4-epimerase/fuculose-1-phosphate aldolase